MQGYYDYHPTHHLDRHLTLVSFVNQLTRTVAHTLASTTGLPLSLIDELVEHELGGSAHKIIESRGLDVWRSAEKREVAKAVASRPPSIIALGEGTLSDPDSLNLALDASELVYLYLPGVDACRWASQQSANHSASLWAEIDAIGGPHYSSLQALFEGRRYGYELAHLTIDTSKQSLLDTSNLLRDRLTPIS
jgi:shikimate kinase